MNGWRLCCGAVLVVALACGVTWRVWQERGLVGRANEIPTATERPETRVNPQGVIRGLRARVARSPRDARLRAELAAVLRGTRQYHEAEQQYDVALRLEPRSAFLLYSMASLAGEMGREERALALYEKGADLRASGADGNVWRSVCALKAGQTRSRRGQVELAEGSYEKCLALYWAYRPEWVVTGMDNTSAGGHFGADVVDAAHTGLARARTQLSRSRPSLGWVRKQMPWFQFPGGAGKRSASRASEIRNMRAVLERGGGGAGFCQYLGSLYLETGAVDDAAILLRAALESNPRDVIAASLLGTACMMQGRFDRAAAAFDHARSLGDQPAAEMARNARAVANRWKQAPRSN